MRFQFFNKKTDGRNASRPASRQIGIIRTLYYYYYPGLWELFFTLIDYEPILSTKTDRRTIDLAGRISEPEHCLPVKLFDAHLAALAERVDRIFVPRMLSSLEGHISCPKLGALPDVAAISVAAEILTIDIDERQAPLEKSLEQLAGQLGLGKKAARQTARQALDAWRESCPSAINDAATDKDRFLILGHPYLLHDDYITGGIFRKLEALSIEAVPVTLQAAGLPDNFIKWDTAGKMYDHIMSVGVGDYRGIIQLSAFNCGCDSITLDMFREAIRQKGLPYLVLMLDEHTAQGGIDTRLEAFVDSVNWRREDYA